MTLELVYRPQFIYLTFITIFYSRTLLFSFVSLAILAWLGFRHPEENDTGLEIAVFLINFSIGIALLAGAWIVVLRRDLLALMQHDLHFILLERVRVKDVVRVFVAVVLVAVTYLTSEGTGYSKSIVHRWSAVAAAMCIQTFVYLYDKNSDSSGEISYSLLPSKEAGHHICVAWLFVVLALIDISIRQTLAQNIGTAVVAALYVVLRIDRIQKVLNTSRIFDSQSNKKVY